MHVHNVHITTLVIVKQKLDDAITQSTIVLIPARVPDFCPAYLPASLT